MKRYLYMLIVVMVLVSFPLVTNASWWNPISWFGSSSSSSQNQINNTELLKRINDLESKVDEKNSTTTSASVNNVVAPNKLDTKIITKTIQVDNPDLQKKINILLSENQSLKSQISDLQKQLLSAQSNTNTTSQITNNSARIRAINLKLAELNKLDSSMDNFTNVAILEALNSAKTIEGAHMFDPTTMRLPVVGSNNTIVTVPDIAYVHRIIEGYRQNLKVELAGIQ